MIARLSKNRDSSALLFYNRTVIDMVLAAIVYFTSAFISVVVYSTSRIADALKRREGQF
jgi:hypothetical protein